MPPLRISQKQLLTENHPFWQRNPHEFFLAWQNGECVGRIAAIINKEHNVYHHVNEGSFGFLEAKNEAVAFRQLLKAAENFCAQNGCANITGPLNPSLHYELGVLTTGFNSPPYFMLTHNASYYDARIKEAGYQKQKDFYSYLLDGTRYVPTQKMQRVSAFLKERYKITIRQAEQKAFEKEMAIFYSLYTDAFNGHWGFTPMAKDEFYLMAKEMKNIIDPRLILIAEREGEPIAFLLCLPNLNEVLIKIKNGRLFPFGLFRILAGRKKIKSARVVIAAVKKSQEHLGLGALLYPELMQRGLRYGYEQCELSWVVEDNVSMNRIANDLQAQPYKTYRLYHKTLPLSSSCG